MTAWLADPTLTHLREVADWPDLGARYQVGGRLGRGGMGVVYAAHDRTLDRDVAVKVIDAPAAAGDAAARLLDEARILARLEHPGIVPVHDAGMLDDGRVFYVMKLVRGERLRDVLARDESPGARLELLLRVCEAVAFAHARGVVHRDLKPDNIMVGPFGEVLVMDWGIAALLESSGATPMRAGTPGFMPPEQTAGNAMPDPRQDVYALGALLEAVLPRPAPRPLAAIAARARAEAPADRYRGVEAFRQDVVRYRDGRRVEAYRETLRERAARVYGRYRIPILLVLAYVFAMLLGGFLGIFDGLTALISAPQEAPNIVGIVIGSTIKGVMAGLIIGLIARKIDSLAVGIGVGLLVGAGLAALVTIGGPYFWEIVLPGAAVGLIVGYATFRYGAPVDRHARI